MRAITNTAIIESRSKWAKRVAPLTMLFLLGGLITNFLSINQPEYFRPTLILLALGFVFATISSHLVNRWVREPRADQLLTTALKKFSNDYVLFNYTSPIPHVLLSPSGLYILVVKNQDGQFHLNGRHLSRKFRWGRIFKFFGEEGLGAPIAEAENRVDGLSKFLHKNLTDEEIPEPKPIVIFTNKKADLLVNDPPFPVMRANELKSYLREEGKQRAISAVHRRTLTEVIGGQWLDGEKTKN